MSQREQGEELRSPGAVGEEPRAARSRQPNGTAGEPVRRSWRPCQMMGQDEQNPHHHHHPPPPHQHHQGRGPPRHRKRPSPGHDSEPHLTHPARPGVSRYRRQGDNAPRVRGHRQRPPQSPDPPRERRTPDGPMEQQRVAHAPLNHQSQDAAAPDLTPVAIVTPTDHKVDFLTPDLTPEDQLPPSPLPSPLLEDNQEEAEGFHPITAQYTSAEGKNPGEEDEGWEEECVEEERREEKDGGEDGGEDEEGVEGEEAGEEAEEDEGGGIGEEGGEDVGVERSEDGGRDEEEEGANDPCSDTESAASLSMEAPPHSPPPLLSPSTPSSPDTPKFPPLRHQLDHFDQYDEDPSQSPTPDDDPLPDDERSPDSYSYSTSYPKTYADFYTQAHPHSNHEPFSDSYSEPYAKSYPSSFPEPLKVSYPELPREPGRRSGRRADQSYPSHRHRPREAPEPHPADRDFRAPRQSRDVGSHRPSAWQGTSVGSRLHHYNGHSDGEGDSSRESLSSHNLPPPTRYTMAEAQVECPRPGRGGPGESQDETGLSEKSARGSGDAITLAIKDIKEAIEEVKIKTVRSPYTPDRSIEPVWVMRQEVSPSEEEFPSQPLGGNNSSVPQSPSQSFSQSPSLYPPAPTTASAPIPEPAFNVRAESSRTHQSQQREPPRLPQPTIEEIRRAMPSFPTFVEVPGPCDPDDLIDGIIFAASYLGSTHLLSERTPTKSARMQQAQEAMSRVRAAQKQAKNRKKPPETELPASTEVDLFMSTQRIKVLHADNQESLMDLLLRTISYIADIGNMVVLMARGKMVRSRSAQDNLDQTNEHPGSARDDRRQYRMVCHVFESEDAQLIAQSIGQAFSVAYQEFLRANGIDPEDLSQREYSDLLNTQDMYNDDLIHFSKSENCRDVYIEKQKGEILGVVIVESGWGSILPTVIIASMMHSGPAEKSGRLNIGDQIMTINGTSLVGLPLNTCQSIIKGLKPQSRIKMNMVKCPPVTMVLIRRPDLRYQLGFSVQNGIICSLMRGGIAERGGVRVGHRIIEINSQSVVATPHEKIVHILSNAVGEIHMKTMPAAMYRLLTAQEQPVYI
ncbi:amyloid-beta A4 precursor protein-binding family A member 1 isoform X2 [Osmerus eperlanus]|uniref:amyloid-beta A4 precursor protein-binding family A member 1 isoform X2 n=1 Tax=Osmerus eperlanus TaxID=29151 RepID=UPI002E11756B